MACRSNSRSGSSIHCVHSLKGVGAEAELAVLCVVHISSSPHASNTPTHALSPCLCRYAISTTSSVVLSTLQARCNRLHETAAGDDVMKASASYSRRNACSFVIDYHS